MYNFRFPICLSYLLNSTIYTVKGKRSDIHYYYATNWGFKMYNTFTAIGTNNSAGNVRSHQCDKLVWLDSGKHLVTKLYSGVYVCKLY